MSLAIIGLDGGGVPVDVEVPAGACAGITVPDPLGFVQAAAGLRRAAGRIDVAGRRVSGLTPEARWAAGLATAVGALPPALDASVLDVVLLGRRPPRGAGTWQLAIGSRRARAALADMEAATRAMCGRIGLGPWIGAPVERVPDAARALADVARALAAAPVALVWRHPDRLTPGEVEAIEEVVAVEGARLGAAVLRVDAMGGGTQASRR